MIPFRLMAVTTALTTAALVRSAAACAGTSREFSVDISTGPIASSKRLRQPRQSRRDGRTGSSFNQRTATFRLQIGLLVHADGRFALTIPTSRS